MGTIQRVSRNDGRYLAWAVLYTTALLVTQLPGDPEGNVPPWWLAVIYFLAWSAWRGRPWRRAAFVVLQGLFLTTFLALGWPISAQLWIFYGLLALAFLVAVVRLPAHVEVGGGVPEASVLPVA